MKFIYILFFKLMIFNVSAQQENDVLSKIIMQKKDNFIILSAKVENEGVLFKEQLSYIFIALKKGKDGKYSNNKQSGDFSLDPHEEKELAIIRININNEEELRSHLLIMNKNKLVSKDSIFISDTQETLKKQRQIKENDFILKGIVVDEAFTKIGKDFYDFFYQEYLLSNRKYPFIIKIKEKPSFARSSILSLEVEDYKIYEFFAKPDEEYLKSNVKIVLQRIGNFAKRREQLRKINKI